MGYIKIAKIKNKKLFNTNRLGVPAWTPVKNGKISKYFSFFTWNKDEEMQKQHRYTQRAGAQEQIMVTKWDFLCW